MALLTGADHDAPMTTAARRLTAVSGSSRSPRCPSPAGSPDIERSRVLSMYTWCASGAACWALGLSCPHALRLASARLRADAPRFALLLLSTYSKCVHDSHSINSPAGSPPLRCAPFRPVLQGQRLRLGPDHHATVAPPSLRSVVRPHHRAALRPMSLGPGDCAAIVYL